MAKILMIEDDQTIREGVLAYLENQGYHVEGLDHLDSLTTLNLIDYDLLIIDVMLPGMDGFQILEEIRRESDILILMLTALSDEYTQVKLFDLQCDDYLAKPFSLKVLEKRIEALLKRGHVTDTWKQGEIEVDFDSYTACKGGQPVDLKLKEIQVLKYLIQHPNQVLSRSQLIDGVYGLDENPLERVIDVYIKNLRKKLSLEKIKTVKGVGYMYED